MQALAGELDELQGWPSWLGQHHPYARFLFDLGHLSWPLQNLYQYVTLCDETDPAATRLDIPYSDVVGQLSWLIRHRGHLQVDSDECNEMLEGENS